MLGLLAAEEAAAGHAELFRELKIVRRFRVRSVAVVGFLIVMLVQFESPSAINPAEDRKSVSPKFVVYSSEKDAELRSSLFKVLRGKEKVTRLQKAETIEKAVASEADVLVLLLPKRELPKLEKGTLQALKKRKIIGIGFGAAQLFGQLGLEINGGNCAHGVLGPPSVMICTSKLMGEPKNAKPLLVLREAAEPEPDAHSADFFAVFLPPSEEKSSVVDVIARWTSDANYAPIVRQDNCVLIGIPVPSTRWTEPYAELIRHKFVGITQPGVLTKTLEKLVSAVPGAAKPAQHKDDGKKPPKAPDLKKTPAVSEPKTKSGPK